MPERRQPLGSLDSSGLKIEAPASRVMLKNRALQQIKELIQAGDLTPQSTLSERLLAARLGMSKTPIRAALENLESQGLVTVSPQKGILVRELSAREIAELFDVRASVEPFIVAQLARSSLTSSQREKLKANLREQRLVARSEDSLAATHLDIAFHRLLAELLENREMMIWLERCFDKLHRSVLRINRLVPGRLHKSYKDHEAIARSVMEGLHDEAAQLMREHLSFGRRFLLVGDAISE
jgi:DNA-binding GntR family transcriptional regulator